MLADSIMSIAESRSIEVLGDACGRAVGRLSGSRTIGLYLLSPDKPKLIFSSEAPEGFLDDYERHFSTADPFVDSILDGAGVVDGVTLHGTQSWRNSLSYELLRFWGFSSNMCGPLRCDDAVIGVFYTATAEQGRPYTPLVKQQMSMLCRACSLALESLARNGRLNADTTAEPAAPGLPAVRSGGRLSATLPPRSAQVARLVCKGQTNKVIARQLGISDQTVKEHVTNLCRRFGAQNRTELAALLLSTVAVQ
ncbi:LuxR C-terminal-related transcriptional regulator [Microbaculum sp. FT89]|uniref:LuxR C-terminal-related transcriptional regulator n=1 Tax=Microbaculum sp. FT89 TaxID=3447298 RepID=UPI003F53C0B0